MSVLFFEGFDLYPAATTWNDGTFWGYQTDFSNKPPVSTADPRNGTRALSLTPAGFGQDIYTRVVPNSTILGAGIAWKKSAPLDSGNTGFGFIGTVGRIMATMDNTGRFVVQRNGVVILTGTTAYNNGLYNYVEIEYDGGANTATLRVNNTQEATGPCANLGVMSLFFVGRWGNPGIAGTLYVDDLIVWNGVGTFTNTFPGDTAVILMPPNADTAQADWTPTPGPNGFSAIDNVPPDIAQFIESAVVGDISTFDVGAPPPSVFQVRAIAHQFRAQKTSAGDGNIQGSIIGPFGPAVGTDRVLTNGTYNSFQDIAELDPNTGQPWDPTDLPALQVSYERTL